MSLYLKYRPKTIEELDLAGVRKTLGDMVAANKLAHAYLFTGPRGAGKTSAARILARIINCEQNAKKLGEPCNECAACLSIISGSAVDVVEIDAASNRGIDDIRELKERIRLSPAILRKKVYIIDEVHMLTTEAFNALLKTLEEPPDHAVFILCTTESHKVPETIASRCVRVSFTKATVEEMKRSFARVVAAEKAEIDTQALEVIAAAVDGSFRDGVKILDTALTSGKHVGVAEVELILYGASGYTGKALAEALVAKDLNAALDSFHKATGEGVDVTHLVVSLMKDLRAHVLETLDTGLITLVYSLDDVARKISTSPLPSILVEMVIVEWCAGSDSSANPSASSGRGQRISKPSYAKATEGKSASQKVANTSAAENVAVETHPEPVVESVTALSNVVGPIGGVDAAEAWHKLTASLSGENYSLAALLSKARPGMITGNVLTIQMSHEFHREQLMHEKFRSRVEKLVSDVVGQPMRVDCIVTKIDKLQSRPIVATIAEAAPEENELMEAAEEIFSN